MDFLRPLYNQDLDSEGDVEIVGSSFARSRILSELEPNTYDLTFEDWLSGRKMRLLEKADEILAQYDNANRFAQLKRSFKAGNVKPFVGAGMSMPSEYSGWTNFLYQLCEESHVDTAELDVLLAGGNYELAAQRLHDDLGAALFNENVESAFYKSNEIKGPVQYLPVLFSGCSVITTNFDDVLERVYQDQADNGFYSVRSGAALPEVLRNLASGSRLLIKLHGDCRVVADRVLLKSEYDVQYADKGVVSSFFNRVVFSGPLLFLGCSISFDRTMQAMSEVVEAYDANTLPRHYAFLALGEGDDRVARKKELAKANVFPIWYFEDDHEECLEALFLALLED